MPASNTKECFSEFIGQRVKGVLFDALPVGDKGLSGGTKTLVFEDGRALTFTSKGSFWIDDAGEVTRAINLKRHELSAMKRELAGVLELAVGKG